jgi:hypothetical protein
MPLKLWAASGSIGRRRSESAPHEQDQFQSGPIAAADRGQARLGMGRAACPRRRQAQWLVPALGGAGSVTSRCCAASKKTGISTTGIWYVPVARIRSFAPSLRTRPRAARRRVVAIPGDTRRGRGEYPCRSGAAQFRWMNEVHGPCERGQRPSGLASILDVGEYSCQGNSNPTGP